MLVKTKDVAVPENAFRESPREVENRDLRATIGSGRMNSPKEQRLCDQQKAYKDYGKNTHSVE